eukprot:TRINITY_DN12960_c0_g1_i1.p1 TRINITY_DN12960_c0_g1~~TRINITY_DN12960_c0_g1_i1.p1  ORF type:complete len:267 (-),score=35.93 TRINITY_DN12960_c0_g1_i1:8-808(-)
MSESNTHLSYSSRSKHCQNEFGKELFHLIETKKTNLCVAADVTTKQALLDLAEKIGPQICLLKTHIDIVSDYDKDLILQLELLAKKHKFFIFEDRKFADIGAIAAQQYEGGIFKIATWAHATNAHVVSGPSSISSLKPIALKHGRGLMLIASMSTVDAQTNNQTVNVALEIARKNKDVVFGFICQNQIGKIEDDLGFLYCAPGIHLSSPGDDSGQGYHSPETMIIERGIDVIIVGRGITHADDKEAAAKVYRESGWKAYLKRIESN